MSGPWRTAITPYLREVMDALIDPNVEEIVLVFGSQNGKTEAIFNMIYYIIAMMPDTIMFVCPNDHDCWKNSQARVMPAVEEMPLLKSLFFTGHNNKILQKRFLGGTFHFASSRSASALAATPAPYVFQDEVDRFPDDVGKEGHPVDVVEKRTTGWATAGRKNVKSSTPKLLSTSRIWKDFLQTNQCYYHVPCWSCGDFQKLVRTQIIMDRDDEDRLLPHTARYECEHCGAPWTEVQKIAALQDGVWEPTNPNIISKVGFHLNTLYSPFLPIVKLAEEWAVAQEDTSKLKVFINTRLAEPWDDNHFKPVVETHELAAREEDYDANSVPNGVIVVTNAFDVQGRWIEYETLGHGKNGETWQIDYGQFPGHYMNDKTWEGLDEVLAKRYVRNDGAVLKASITVVDSS